MRRSSPPSTPVTSRSPCPRRSGSSARATASTATTPPTSRSSWRRPPASRRASSPTALAEQLAGVAGVEAVDIAGPGLPQHHPGRRERRRAGPLDRRRRRGVRPQRPPSRPRRQPGVRLGQPDRPAAHRRTPAGRRSATPCAGCSRPRAPRSPRVLLQRRRRPDRPVRRLGAGPGRRAGRPRGRLPRRVHRRPRRRGARAAPRPARPRRRRGAGGRPRSATSPSSPRSSRPSTASACTSTSGSPSAALHDGGAVEQAVDRLREQGHVFDADGAVWLRTTDFGDDKDRVLIRADGEPDLLRRRLRLLPRQAGPRLRPRRSTCSAPTTTATSAG